MENIKTFIEEFLEAEAETTHSMRQPNLDQYNNALQKMNHYCVESLYNTFGLVPLQVLDDQEYYEKWSTKKYPNPRHLYKISRYEDKIYGSVYVAYVSEKNPDDEIFLYGVCIFVTEIKGGLKIIKKYSFGDSMRIKDKFEAGVGLNDISFETLGKPVAIERYKEPKDDEDAMEHYLMDV